MSKAENKQVEMTYRIEIKQSTSLSSFNYRCGNARTWSDLLWTFAEPASVVCRYDIKHVGDEIFVNEVSYTFDELATPTRNKDAHNLPIDEMGEEFMALYRVKLCMAHSIYLKSLENPSN
jgi:hypothetical protein